MKNKNLFWSLVMVCLVSVALVRPAAAHADGSDEMNFRFSPIPLVVGMVGVNLDFKIADQWTLGPQLAYWHASLSSSDNFTENFDFTAYAIGARANWFANGAYNDGLYVGPSLVYSAAKVTTSDDSGSLSATASGLEAGCIVGYAWFWDSFNIMLGGGVVLPLGADKVTVTDNNGNSVSENVNWLGDLALEFSLGWTF